MSRVIHFEIPADDVSRAKRFYEEVLGWSFTTRGGPMEYWFASTGPEGTPGIDGALAPRSDPAERVTNTIGVDSLDATLALVEANGGRIVRPKGAIPGVGYLAYIADSEGNEFGLMESDPTAA